MYLCNNLIDVLIIEIYFLCYKETNMEESKKSSIFLCKHCKADVEVNKRVKKSDNKDEIPIVITLKPAIDNN